MTPLSRRSFLCALATPLATSASGRTTAHARARLCFSTLGCPAWDWKTILAQAAANGYAGIELRDSAARWTSRSEPSFRRAAWRRPGAIWPPSISRSSASAPRPGCTRPTQPSALRSSTRAGDSSTWPAPSVPGTCVSSVTSFPAISRAKRRSRASSGPRPAGAHAAGSGVTVVIESHGDFTDSATLRRVLSAVDRPEVALLWDAHHTFVAAGEAPETTWRQVGSLVRHTHLKDSRPLGDGARRYVLTGAGNVPVRETLAASRPADTGATTVLSGRRPGTPRSRSPRSRSPTSPAPFADTCRMRAPGERRPPRAPSGQPARASRSSRPFSLARRGPDKSRCRRTCPVIIC